MKKIKILKNIELIFFSILIVCLIIYILKLKIFGVIDNDYKNVGLTIEDYNVEYSTTYSYDKLSKYKVYKIKNYYSNSMEKFKNQLENSDLWSRDKFYEYIMKEFYELKEDDSIEIDRENLYYYYKKGIYAIFDLKNAKLYYFENNIFNEHKDYSEILGIKTKEYIEREIYDVRGGPQNDGTDYYTYKFTEDKGNEIIETLNTNSKWSKNKLDNDKLDNFKYNEEVLSIENGYYHYELVCRTSDENKKKNITKENATGYEIGVYDVDKNILYYYWTSY